MSGVRLMVRVKQGDKYPYLPAEVASNGKIKPVPDATYHLRFTENGKRKLVSVGDDPAQAAQALAKQNAILGAQAAGLVIQPFAVTPEKSTAARVRMADAIKDYLAEIKEHKARLTHMNYKRALELFTEGCKVEFIDEVSRDCMLKFSARLKKDGYAPRSVANYFAWVYTLLKRNGKADIVSNNDWPRYEEVEAEIYSDEDVVALLKACESPEQKQERLLVLFAANTGFRKREISFAQMGDVDFIGKTIQTRSKPESGFTTKDYEQRIVPVGDSLLDALRGYKGTTKWIFPSREGTPDVHLERIMKPICKRAGVVIPRKPTHAFRAYFATRLVRAGIDIYTVQRLLGHSNASTTQSYLRAVKRSDPKLREQVNAASVG